MKIGDYYIDFVHNVKDGWTQVYLYEDPRAEPIAEAYSTVHYKDRFARKAGRRACMQRLLSPKAGAFAGDDHRAERAAIWRAYWERMPQDLSL
jgi:hypothetical protein